MARELIPSPGERRRTDWARRASSVAFAALLLGALGGCTKYYWSRAAGTPEQFDRDNQECAREATPSATAGAYGPMDREIYRGCMTARGWIREKQWEPPPPGWYRGIE